VSASPAWLPITKVILAVLSLNAEGRVPPATCLRSSRMTWAPEARYVLSVSISVEAIGKHDLRMHMPLSAPCVCDICGINSDIYIDVIVWIAAQELETTASNGGGAVVAATHCGCSVQSQHHNPLEFD